MNGSLRIIIGNGVQRVIPLQYGRYAIGRSRDVPIQIDSHQVSRKHAEVVVGQDVIRLYDCGSSNGTFLNGSQVTSADLKDGDRITIGEVVLEYRADHDPKSSVMTRLAEKKKPTTAPSRRPRSLRRLFFGAFFLSTLSLILAGGFSFRSILQDRLSDEAMDRAHELTRYLAEKNREDLRIGNELLLDVESVIQSRGVREAYIINQKGIVVAPISHLNRPANDPFTTEAMAQRSDRKILPSPRLPDGTYIFVHPIRAYNDNLGTYETLGVAKIVFSPADAIGSLSAANRLIFLLLACSVGLALLLAWASSRMLSEPLERLAERMQRWKAGLATDPEAAPFTEWKSVYDAVDRATEEEIK